MEIIAKVSLEYSPRIKWFLKSITPIKITVEIILYTELQSNINGKLYWKVITYN